MNVFEFRLLSTREVIRIPMLIAVLVDIHAYLVFDCGLFGLEAIGYGSISLASKMLDKQRNDGTQHTSMIRRAARIREKLGQMVRLGQQTWPPSGGVIWSMPDRPKDQGRINTIQKKYCCHGRNPMTCSCSSRLGQSGHLSSITPFTASQIPINSLQEQTNSSMPPRTNARAIRLAPLHLLFVFHLHPL